VILGGYPLGMMRKRRRAAILKENEIPTTHRMFFQNAYSSWMKSYAPSIQNPLYNSLIPNYYDRVFQVDILVPFQVW
jgi:hypothetical protein